MIEILDKLQVMPNTNDLPINDRLDMLISENGLRYVYRRKKKTTGTMVVGSAGIMRITNARTRGQSMR